MFTPPVRIVLVVVGLIFTYNFFDAGAMPVAVLTLCAVVLIAVGYFRNGTVYLTSKKIKKNDFDKAEKVLNQTRYPGLLSKQDRGFYYFYKGMIELNKNDSENAYQNFLEALKLGTRTENNTAIIKLNLAIIEMKRGRESEVRKYLEEIKSMKYSAILEPEIFKLNEKMNSSSQ